MQHSPDNFQRIQCAFTKCDHTLQLLPRNIGKGRFNFMVAKSKEKSLFARRTRRKEKVWNRRALEIRNIVECLFTRSRCFIEPKSIMMWGDAIFCHYWSATQDWLEQAHCHNTFVNKHDWIIHDGELISCFCNNKMAHYELFNDWLITSNMCGASLNYESFFWAYFCYAIFFYLNLFNFFKA